MAVGRTTSGSQRWLQLGFISFQPSELTKIAKILALTRYFEVLAEIARVHSVEKIVLAHETRERNPTHFEKAAAAFGQGVAVEEVPHAELKTRSREVKTIVRTGDFTAWGNVLLVSGAGPRRKMER